MENKMKLRSQIMLYVAILLAAILLTVAIQSYAQSSPLNSYSIGAVMENEQGFGGDLSG